MVIVRRAIAFVGRDVELICAFDEIQMLDGECHLSLAIDTFGFHLLDVGIRSEAADALGVEDADAEHEVAHGLRAADAKSYGDGVAGLKSERRLSVGADELDVADLDLAGSPT